MPLEQQTYRELVKGTLTEIKEQTLKTNGRVSRLERWQSYILGFCAAVSFVLATAISVAAIVFR